MRSFTSSLRGSFLRGYQSGVMRYTYKDVPCLRSPIDLAIQLKLLWELGPKTIVEIGSKAGGTAMLLADMASVYGLDARVVSIDLTPPSPPPTDRVTFIRGDVRDLGTSLGALTGELEHPWLVIEDSAHTFEGCTAALRFFASTMFGGDVLILEDGIVDRLGRSRRYAGGPSRAIRTFLEEMPGIFEIATDLCDMFGPNATYNPNGYLRRVERGGRTP